MKKRGKKAARAPVKKHTQAGIRSLFSGRVGFLAGAIVLVLVVVLASSTILYEPKKSAAPLNYTPKLVEGDPTVSIGGVNGTVNCTFKEGQVGPECYSEDWQRIEWRTVADGGQSRRCLFAHPRNNESVTVTFRDVRLGESLDVTTAIVDDMARGDMSPVYVDVYVGGEYIGRVVQPDLAGWRDNIVGTSAYEGTTSDVKLVIYAEYDEKRHFCFNLGTLDVAAPVDYFYRNLPIAKASLDGRPCDIYMVSRDWPHEERKPPLNDAPLFERWDCVANLKGTHELWNTVARSYAVSGGVGKYAIWFHPQTEKTKSIYYGNIGRNVNEINGFYGVNDLVTDKGVNTQITFKVYVDGREEYSDSMGLDKGWREFTIPVRGTVHDVNFTVSTTNDRWNHFFYNAYLS